MAQAIKSAFLFIVRHSKDAAFIILAILFVLIFWRLKREQSHARELMAKIEGLPPDTKQTITVYRDRVVTKWRTNLTKMESRERYLPPEGNVVIVTKENAPEKPPEVVLKDWGFTSRLGGGMVYSDRLMGMLDFKFFYWRRYSLIVGITSEFNGIGVSRHIDDITPFHALEIVGLFGTNSHGEQHIAGGMRLSF